MVLPVALSSKELGTGLMWSIYELSAEDVLTEAQTSLFQVLVCARPQDGRGGGRSNNSCLLSTAVGSVCWTLKESPVVKAAPV